MHITKKKDEWADCIYLVSKKAFNKVSYRRLLWKFEYIRGLKGTLKLGWKTS